MNAADSLESSSEDDAEFEIQFMKDYLSKQGGTNQLFCLYMVQW